MNLNQLDAGKNRWEASKVEAIDHCPICNSLNKKVAYQNVEDWAFYNSNGQWNYWDCLECGSLFQSPRPKEAFISQAYETYYTHTNANQSFISLLKIKIKNEIYSNLFNINLEPKLNFPKNIFFIINFFRRFIYIPFGLKQIVKLPKGRMLDIGCGDGAFLNIAQALGWQTTGLEVDSKAVAAAIEKGLNVHQGTYEDLKNTEEKFDCIVCSHVIEHVYKPKELLQIIENKLADNGTILLSCPNSQSHMRFKFGENWRGIEAPRHLAIPSTNTIRKYFLDRGYAVDEETIFYGTYIESVRIKKRKVHISFWEFVYIKIKLLFAKKPMSESTDYIQFVIKKPA